MKEKLMTFYDQVEFTKLLTAPGPARTLNATWQPRSNLILPNLNCIESKKLARETQATSRLRTIQKLLQFQMGKSVACLGSPERALALIAILGMPLAV